MQLRRIDGDTERKKHYDIIFRRLTTFRIRFDISHKKTQNILRITTEYRKKCSVFRRTRGMAQAVHTSQSRSIASHMRKILCRAWKGPSDRLSRMLVDSTRHDFFVSFFSVINSSEFIATQL